MLIELSEVSLEVQFHASTSPDSPLLILSHPHPVYGGTMTNKVIDQIYRRSVERDWSVLRYNTRGTGKSTGTYDHGNAEVKDLQELVQWVEQKGTDSSKILLVGYSFGSYLTAMVAANLKLPCILIAPAVTFYQFPVLNFDKSKVIFSAEKDELVDPALIEKYFETLAEPKRFVSIPDADHYFIGTTTQLIREVFKQLDAFVYQL